MSGASRQVRGSLLGTGAARDVKTVGFRPSRVELWNVASGGLVHAYWQDTMPDAYMVLNAVAGDMSYETSDGITPLADGFTIGANTDVNVAGEAIHWVAFD